MLKNHFWCFLEKYLISDSPKNTSKENTSTKNTLSKNIFKRILLESMILGNTFSLKIIIFLYKKMKNKKIGFWQNLRNTIKI